MPVKYKVISTNKPGQGKEGEKIYFPKLTGSRQVNLRDIADILSDRSTASPSDVYLIIMGLVDLIPELLEHGQTVKLDNLGTFRLHARVNTATSPEKVTSRNIKELRLGFLPDKGIKKFLKRIQVFKAN